jgi:predicted RNA-binding Zn-ribbon protein involved in translation (DUF1610 family)
MSDNQVIDMSSALNSYLPKTIYRNLVFGGYLENPVRTAFIRMHWKVKPHEVWEGGVDVYAWKGKKKVVSQCSNLRRSSTCFIGKDRWRSNIKELEKYRKAIKLFITTKPLLKYQREECKKKSITIIELSGQVMAVTEGVISNIINRICSILRIRERPYTGCPKCYARVNRDVGTEFDCPKCGTVIVANITWVKAKRKRRVKYKLLSTAPFGYGEPIPIHVPRWMLLLQIYLRDIKIFDTDKVFGLRHHEPWRPLPYWRRHEDLT